MSDTRASRLGWFASALATLAAIGVLIAYIDQPLAYWAHGLDPAVIAVSNRITQLGDSAWYLVPLAIAGMALYPVARFTTDVERAARLRRILAVILFLFLAIALSGLLVDALKILFGRARPALLLQEGYAGWQMLSLGPKFHSFPSGHANTIVALAFAAGLMLPRLLKPFIVLAALIALTRVVVGKHYLSDVIAGGSLAVATTLLLRTAFARRGWLFGNAPHGRSHSRPSAA